MSDHGGVADRVTVWASRLGIGEEGVKGTLTLEEEHARFEAHQGGLEIAIALRDVRKVRKVAGSAVVVIEYPESRVGAGVAFYFEPPPPLPREGKLFSKREAKQAAAGWFARSDPKQRHAAKRWRDAVRGAVKRARKATG